jgi:hypothetical protein
MVNFALAKRIIITTILITSHTLTIAPKTVHNMSIIIKVGILILFVVIPKRLASVSPWRRMLFNMFNPGDQAVDSAHQLIKLPVDVGALVINKSLKFIFSHTLIEVRK